MPSTHPLYSVAEIREIEQVAQAALPPFTLMRRAGEAAAQYALELLDGNPAGKTVLILAGPGNNGGDALEAAARLADAGAQVTVLHFAEPGKLTDDSRQALEHAKAGRAAFADIADSSRLVESKQWSLIVDGLLGIGLTRAISSPLRELIALTGVLPCPVLALDVPSGLDADTGAIVGPEGIAVRASHTITFIGDKTGLHTCFGRDHAGMVRVANLDIDAQHVRPAHAFLNVSDDFAESLRPRPHNSHKGSYGDAIVVGGAHGMTGAAILAARAAAKCGAGRVFAAFAADPPAYDNLQPELMCRLARDIDFSGGTLIVGPGLGTAPDAKILLTKAVDADAPLVLDADGLNMLAADPVLQDKLSRRERPTLLTPHPLEAARLLQLSVAQVQADRLTAARKLAHRFHATVILKGSGTVIARPDGEIAINPTGSAALATGGTGDVLAGICGALLAQSWSDWHAALAATWLHGHAADLLVQEGTGPIGLTATELIPRVRAALNRLVEQHARQRALR
jgi:ADP-dependent NAD(P)H-hydrate dehydratase / NAD(P)H-hydrate epimerase